MGNFKPGEIGFRMKPEDFGIRKYKFRPDGTLDVFESVFLYNQNLTKLPFKFGKIDGDFNCSYNKLTSLKGTPEEVDGDFGCSRNNLINLKYSPKIVNGWFDCSRNNLTNLKNVPEIINGDFYCIGINLTSLKGLNLDGITGEIYVTNNPDLKLTEKEQLWVTLNPGRLVLE